MHVVHDNSRVRIETQLCGSHWVPSVLGAIGGAIAAGATLEECAAGIAAVPPFEARMQPVTTPDGITFIRDDFKAPLWTLDSCFQFMKAARANRKVLVIGSLSDCGAGATKKCVNAAREAQEVADLTIFVGPWASSVLKACKPGASGSLRAFTHVREATQFINSFARAGDLILLKGNNKQDHLMRIILSRQNAVACWRDDCMLDRSCDTCPSLFKPSGGPVPPPVHVASLGSIDDRIDPRPSVDPNDQVIIGLGNPAPNFSGTPHNVGYEGVDQLAASLGLRWESHADAWIARGSLGNQRICLVKMRVAMNLAGYALKQLADQLRIEPCQCILVHDDLDTPLGTVRTRMSGGAGGHMGVASILEAFQTDAFRRVKIGVGKGDARTRSADYVVTGFSESDRMTIARAIIGAKERVVELATLQNKHGISRLRAETSSGG